MSPSIAVDAIYDVDADVFAPCAIGATLNPVTIGRLKMRLVCGAANNQLATSGDGVLLQDNGILYLPDFVVNAGGVILNTSLDQGLSAEATAMLIERIPRRVGQGLERARDRGVPPQDAAEALAREILRAAILRQG